MPSLEWNDTFNVGHKQIDRQHKVLVKIIQDLHMALVDKNEKLLEEFFENLL